MTKHELKRLGVVSVMKVAAAVGFVLGVIYGGLIFLVYLLFGAMIASMGVDVEGAQAGGVMMIVMGVVFAIIVVLCCTIGYALGGAIGAIIYNLISKMMGGIEVELGEKR